MWRTDKSSLRMHREAQRKKAKGESVADIKAQRRNQIHGTKQKSRKRRQYFRADENPEPMK